MSESAPIRHPTWLTTGDFTEADEPLRLFAAWFEEAEKSEPTLPTAMSLATVDGSGLPNVRMVLMKGFDAQGFVFYTNHERRKGLHLTVHPKAAMLFHWKSLRRQVRIEGAVAPVSDAEADSYFATRSRDSQIGAWASDQSRPLASRALFEARYERLVQDYAGKDVPRPPHWRGHRLVPDRIEFWTDRPHRLHERRLFTLGADGGWSEGLLYP
jgi:pyridoxamine 5'-phosphate oxidase